MTMKIMIFIDGSWMYHNKQHIMEAFNTEDFDIDVHQKVCEPKPRGFDKRHDQAEHNGDHQGTGRNLHRHDGTFEQYQRKLQGLLRIKWKKFQHFINPLIFGLKRLVSVPAWDY